MRPEEALEAQWREVERIVGSGRIGELRLITGHFSYYKRDPDDIRSRVEWGGGALMDIGIYAINGSRYMTGEEPVWVTAQETKSRAPL